MGEVDFPTWFNVGSYGGLAFSLVAAATVASYALRLHRGTRRQLARATLLCLICACLMFAPIWWAQARFDLLGPTLDPREITFWLAWTALLGWSLPLGTAAGFALLAPAQPLTGAVPVPAILAGAAGRAVVISHPSALDDPGRLIEPLGVGRAWGQLMPLEGPFALRPLDLKRQVTLLGREADSDIVVPDDQASRHHAEVRWDHGHVHLVDRASLNGTRVNGQVVLGQVPLRDGDVVEIGGQRYRFIHLAPPSGTRAPSGPPTRAAVDAEETRKVPSAVRAPTSSSSTPAPGLALLLDDRPQLGSRWELSGALMTIGRDAGCEIRLSDSSVSRRHAQVVRQATGVYVQDLDSQNGTELNGQRLVAPTPLHPGAVLRIGEVVLRCEASSPRAASDHELAVSGPPAGASSASHAPLAQPNTHTLLSPKPRSLDRPHLAPPRLIPPRSEG